MNTWLQMLGIDSIKPFFSMLLLPPVPWLVLMLCGAVQLPRRRGLGWALVLSGAALQWASSTSAAAEAVTRWLLNPPPAVSDLKALSAPLATGPSVIVVLGGGRRDAAEFPEHSLSTISMERLRYGIWLSRQTGLPWAFSGGLSPGSQPGPSEGEIATRIGRDEFRHPLRWAETQSRDTHENALRTVALLRHEGVGRIVLVTHDLHMPRALRHFERARDAAKLKFELLAAPVGAQRKQIEWSFGDFCPSAEGIQRTRYALREWLGRLARA